MLMGLLREINNMVTITSLTDYVEHPMLLWVFASGVLLFVAGAIADVLGHDSAAGFLAIFGVNMLIFWAFGHLVYLFFNLNNRYYYRKRRSSG